MKIRNMLYMTMPFLLVVLPSYGASVSRRIDTWAVLGPFSPSSKEGLTEDFVGGEVNLRAELGKLVAGHEWVYFDDRLYCRNQDDYNDLYTFFMDKREGSPGGGTENRVAYCGGFLWLPEEKEVVVRFSANDKARVWIGGTLILEQSDSKQAMRDTETVRVTLKKGWNPVLVKVVNERRIWGFYFYLTDHDGMPLEGFEWTPDNPTNATLQIVTADLPKAYNGQPYVALEVRNPSGEFPWDNPSASPFRLCAKGGVPPYRWTVRHLPDGLMVDADEGEFLGKTSALGEHRIEVTVSDSANPNVQVSKEFVLTVAPRPTELWWEKSTRMGGLRHHGISGPTFWTFDHVEEQIDYMKRIGYDWQAYTVFSNWEKGADGQIKICYTPEMLRYRDALRAAGIRFAQYMSFKDFRERATNYKDHADNMHEALEKLMVVNQPVLWIFDEMYGHHFRPPDVKTVEFDALYSLIRTLDPVCLITVNGDTRARDYECGDLDILFVHGAYKEDSYWGYWTPMPLFHNSPKYLPVDTWKLPWKGYMDPQEWCRVIVSQLGDPANLEALRSIQIDPSPFLEADYNTVALLRAIADWMEPRKHTILGTIPLTEKHYDWGYAVYQPANKNAYLHILKNPLGKCGFHERSYIDLELSQSVKDVQTVPGSQKLPFEQHGANLAIDVRNITKDPVDTIIEIVFQP